MGKKIFIVIFSAILLCPPLTNLFIDNVYRKTKENRKLASKPNFTLNRTNESSGLIKTLIFLEEFKSYTKKLDEYYSDGFVFKPQMFKLYCYLYTSLLKSNPIPEKVVAGNNGWFFLGERYSNPVKESKNILNFNEKETAIVEKNILKWKNWFVEREIDFYIAIPPNKHTVYNKYLPIIKNDIYINKTDQFKFICQKLDVNYVDMIGNDFDTNIILYSKTDSHWNDAGAYEGYKNLISEVELNHPQIYLLPMDSLNEKTEVVWEQDLTRMLMKKVKEEKIRFEVKNAKAAIMDDQLKVPKTYAYQPDTYEVRYQSNVNNLKVLIFRDSFSNALIKFISESFGESVFIWKNKLNKEIILKEKPDIVIAICVERSIDAFKYM